MEASAEEEVREAERRRRRRRMNTGLKLQTASLRGKIKTRGQMDPLFIYLRYLITFSRCYFFTLPDSNVRILLSFFTGMKNLLRSFLLTFMEVSV